MNRQKTCKLNHVHGIGVDLVREFYSAISKLPLYSILSQP